MYSKTQYILEKKKLPKGGFGQQVQHLRIEIDLLINGDIKLSCQVQDYYSDCRLIIVITRVHQTNPSTRSLSNNVAFTHWFIDLVGMASSHCSKAPAGLGNCLAMESGFLWRHMELQFFFRKPILEPWISWVIRHTWGSSIQLHSYHGYHVCTCLNLLVVDAWCI